MNVYIKPSDKTVSTVRTAVPLSSSTNAGLMTKEDVGTLADHTSRIESLEQEG
ncbi:MAG: hypothetical protein LBG52_02235 [Candidatus Peribacteria bacterium]|nr:hypothetical protein [Candidatus Peribacteria bacterium]